MIPQSSKAAEKFFNEYGIATIRSNLITNDEMSLSEHIEEFNQRLIFGLILLLLFTSICFLDIKAIVKVLQAPAIGIKFLQFGPGEYFFASVKISLFCGIVTSSPFLIYQILLYVIPGMTKNEREILLPSTIASGILFGLGLIFSYFFFSSCST
jgi:sec-independent protein translocase protein TatC